MADLKDIGMTIVDPLDLTGTRAGWAADEAAATQAAYNQQAMDMQWDMYNQSRTDLLPFLEAVTGGTVYGGQYATPELAYLANNPDVAASAEYKDNPWAHYQKYGKAEGREWYGTPENVGGGILDQYINQLGGAPGAPELGKFEFDVTKALDNPALQFQMQQGEKALDRLAGKNRRLGSGNRLYDLLQFNQGLTSQSIGDEYNRQMRMFDTNQNVDLKNYGLASDRYNTRMNRLAGLIDVGRGTGSALGSLGANTASGISSLLNDTGSGYAAASMAPYNAQMQGINTAATVGGYVLGGPAGGTGANQVTAPSYSSTNPWDITAADSKGFF